MSAATDRRALGRAGVSTLIGTLFSAAAAYVLMGIAVGALGVTGTGLFYQAVALFAIATNALQLGADTTLVRTLSRQVALGEQQRLWRTVRVGIGPVLVTGAVIAVAVWAAADPLAALLAPDRAAAMADSVRTLAPFLLGGSMLAVLLGGTRGLGGTLPYTLLQNVSLPLARLLLLAGAALAGLSLQWFLAAWSAPLALVAVIAAVVLVRQLRRESAAATGTVRPAPSEVREFWRFSFSRGAATVLERALDWSGVLIVIATAGPALGGIYAVVTRCANAGSMLEQAARIVTGPRISRALAVGDHKEAESLFLDVTRALIAISWPFYLLLAVFAPVVLGIFGPDFVAGAPALTLVSLAMMLATTAGMVQSILLMGGRSSWQLANRAIQLTTLLTVTVALVPSLGLLGAAIGWVAAILVDTTLATVQVSVKMGIRSAPRLIAVPALTATLVVGGGGLLTRALLGNTVIALVTALAVLAVLYLAACVLLRRQLGLDFLLPKALTRSTAASSAGSAAGPPTGTSSSFRSTATMVAPSLTPPYPTPSYPDPYHRDLSHPDWSESYPHPLPSDGEALLPGSVPTVAALPPIPAGKGARS